MELEIKDALDIGIRTAALESASRIVAPLGYSEYTATKVTIEMAKTFEAYIKEGVSE